MRGGQGLEATLKLNSSTLYRQWEQHQFTELHLIQRCKKKTWSKVWQERDRCRHYSLCGVFLGMLLVNVGLFWKLQQVWKTTLITPSLHFHALADLLEDLGKLQCWWNNLVISRRRIFFWKLDRRNKIYLLEVYKFLLLEGDCRIFAASEYSLNTLH